MSKFKTLSLLFPGLGRELTERENWAVTWAKQSHGWRKRWSETWESRKARRPDHIPMDVWKRWYFYPYGDREFNESALLVRALFKEMAENKAKKRVKPCGG